MEITWHALPESIVAMKNNRVLYRVTKAELKDSMDSSIHLRRLRERTWFTIDMEMQYLKYVDVVKNPTDHALKPKL